MPIEIENPAAHNRRCQSDGVGERKSAAAFGAEEKVAKSVAYRKGSCRSV